MGCRLDDKGSIPGCAKKFFSTPHQFWGPLSLLPSGKIGVAIPSLPDMSSWRDALSIKQRDKITFLFF
jgi:hypothetical protein